MSKQQARVGVGVLVMREGDGKILVGKRKGSLGEGEWALPGGHLEFQEEFDTCAARELLEETGIKGNHTPIFEHAVNTIFPHGAHYVTIFMKVVCSHDQIPQTCEPHKCEGWVFVDWEDLKTYDHVFLPLRKLIETGYLPTL